MKLTSTPELTNVAKFIQGIYNHVMGIRRDNANMDRQSPVKDLFDFKYFNQCLKEEFHDLIVGEKTVSPKRRYEAGRGIPFIGWEYDFEYELSSPEGLAWRAKVKAVVTNHCGCGYGGISEAIESIDITRI